MGQTHPNVTLVTVLLKNTVYHQINTGIFITHESGWREAVKAGGVKRHPL
jgi:hypothetical protein